MKVIVYGSDPATCPVRAVQDWLELAGTGEGLVFRVLPARSHHAGALNRGPSLKLLGFSLSIG